jgi:hypothetical protein
MWWLFGIGIVVYIIYTFNKGYNENVEAGVTRYGGMRNKYSVIVNYFIHCNSRITKETKDCIILSSPSMVLTLDYVGYNLEVEMNGTAPMIGNYSKKWIFPDGYPQEKMIQDIENYCDWLKDRIMNLS